MSRNQNPNRMINRDKKKKVENPFDFYETPAVAVEELLKREKFKGYIWEPCAGKGAISKILLEHGHVVITSDVQNYGYPIRFQKNFLETWQSAPNIVTNPPYNIAEEIVRHALRCAKKKVAMLLRIQFLEGQARYKFFQEFPPNRVWIFSKRITCDADGTNMYCFAWFVWDIFDLGAKPDTIIGWILH